MNFVAKTASNPKVKNRSLDRYVAFLRGVNVGGRTAKSPDLIAAFEKLKLKNVATFLASGNVVFDASNRDLQELRDAIEKGLLKALEFECETFLRSIEQVANIASLNPFDLSSSQEEDFTVNVILLNSPGATGPQKKQLQTLVGEIDDFAFDGSEIYWLCRGKKMSDSPLFEGNRLGKALSMSNTVRNIRTMQRLAAKFG